MRRRLFALALLTGCTSAELVVDVRSDYAPGLEVDEIVIEVDGAASRSVPVQESYDLLERGVRTPAVPLSPGRHEFVVSLRRAGVAVPIASRRSVYNINGSAIVEVWLVRSCSRITCPPTDAPEATACDRGRCVPPDCVDSTCVPDQCLTAEECDRTGLAPCARVTCSDGRCLAAADDATCAPRICDPELGCVDVAFLDAGVPRDAGMDGGPAGVDAPERPDVPVSVDAPIAVPDTPMDVPPLPPYLVFRLAPGSTVWEPVTTSGAEAPATPVLAAFTSRALGGIAALTATTAHLLSVPGHVWTASVPRSTSFPDLEGTSLLEITELTGLDDLHLFAFTTTERIDLTWSPTTVVATLNARVPNGALEPYWYTPVSPPWGEILGVYGRASDPENWVSEDPGYGCGGVFGPHYTFWSRASAASPVVASVLDGSYAPPDCFEFVSQMSSAEHAPLVYATGFDYGLVEAVTEYDGLYVFTRGF